MSEAKSRELNLNVKDWFKDHTARILVADDDRFHREVFKDLITDMGHQCLTVGSGHDVMERVRTYRPDLLIVDVVMPGLNGFEITRRLKGDTSTMHVPVLIVTSLSDKGSKLSGLESGADEILSKPVDHTEFRARIKNLLKVKRFEDLLLEYGRNLEGEVLSKSEELENAYRKIRHGYIETIYRLTLAAEYRDNETGGHIKRISLFSRLLARSLGLGEDKVEAIFFASPMHDVGKIGIPDSILLSPGRHTSEESEVMRTHTTIGANILHKSDSEILQTAEEIALTHHENWDGSGYPRGISEEEIPISGMIVHIVDIYDALRSKRPYKLPFDHHSSLKIIGEERDKFDPRVLEAFMECASEIKGLFDDNQDDSFPAFGL